MFSLTFDGAAMALLLSLLSPTRLFALPLDTITTTATPWNSLPRPATTHPDLHTDLPHTEHTHPKQKRELTYRLALPLNFADVSIFQSDNRYWAFATTNDMTANIQVAISSDFTTWIYLQDYDALPFAGAWTHNLTSSNGWQNSRVWAPNVIQNDDGIWVMYYSALATDTMHCIGVATSTNIQGPYVPAGEEPMICPQEIGGAIDASGFRDADGSRWMVYKIDGNSLGNGGSCNNDIPPIQPTPILLQRLSPDGLKPLNNTPPIQILDRDPLDGPVIEAPALSRTSDGRYILFFSSNCYDSALYDVSYAIADTIEGPYTKYGPFALSETTGLFGPGGAHIMQADDGLAVQQMAFHAGPVGQRWMYTAELAVEGVIVGTV